MCFHRRAAWLSGLGGCTCNQNIAGSHPVVVIVLTVGLLSKALSPLWIQRLADPAFSIVRHLGYKRLINRRSPPGGGSPERSLEFVRWVLSYPPPPALALPPFGDSALSPPPLSLLPRFFNISAGSRCVNPDPNYSQAVRRPTPPTPPTHTTITFSSQSLSCLKFVRKTGPWSPSILSSMSGIYLHFY